MHTMVGGDTNIINSYIIIFRVKLTKENVLNSGCAFSTTEPNNRVTRSRRVITEASLAAAGTPVGGGLVNSKLCSFTLEQGVLL